MLVVQAVIPEYVLHAVLTAMFLVRGEVCALLFNVPLLVYNINKCVRWVVVYGGTWMVLEAFWL